MITPATSTLLFVYGTLRHGEEGQALLAGARLLGRVATEPRYELVNLGEYPALVERGQDSVVGELYEVPNELLPALDEFEDVPTLYERRPVRLQDSCIKAQAYLMHPAQARDATRIPSGDWCKR